MKFKQVLFIDSFSPASHHEQYNAAIVMMLTAVFDRIVYFVGNGQIRFKGALPYYYDTFAFVPIGGDASRKNDETYFESRRVNRSLRHTSYLPCLSAFGALGVYRWNAVRELSYEALFNTRSRTMEAVCEHISFNIRALGAKYVCRDMRLDYGDLRTVKHLTLYSLLPVWLFAPLYRLFDGKKFED